MEVGSSNDIPEEAGCCARFEARGIVDEVGDDHFQKLVRKSVRLATHCDTCSIRNTERECVIDCGPVPNGVGGEVTLYNTSTTRTKVSRVRDRYYPVVVRPWRPLGFSVAGLVLTAKPDYCGD